MFRIMTTLRDGIIYDHLCGAVTYLRVDAHRAEEKLSPWDPILSRCSASGRLSRWWRRAARGLIVCWAKSLFAFDHRHNKFPPYVR